MSNLAKIMTNSAQQYPQSVAIKFDDFEMSYAELEVASQLVAGYLQAQGLKPGDRVALSIANVPAFAYLFFGTLRMGGVIVPMNPLFTPREVQYYLEDSGASIGFGMTPDFATGAQKTGTPAVMVGPDQLKGLLAEQTPFSDIVDRADEDTAVILYTSGTTGKPKGAQLTHYNLYKNTEVCAETLFELEQTDRMLAILPLFHVFGLTCLFLVAMYKGAFLTIVLRFEPHKALEVIERDKATIISGVPTMYQGMLLAAEDRDYDLSTVRAGTSGGSAMPVEVIKAWEKRFGFTPLEGFGMSETSPVVTFNHPHMTPKAGSVGTPIQGVEATILDSDHQPVKQGEVGEFSVRGHCVMKGYWGKPEATEESFTADGWFLTGDLAREDEDGYFYIVDRAKDMIIRGGYNVYPREVEEALYEHPDILECAIVGIPDDYYGEEVVAYIMKREGSALDEAAVQAFAKERVAPYKYPRKVHFLPELPKGATGKILKRELKDH